MKKDKKGRRKREEVRCSSMAEPASPLSFLPLSLLALLYMNSDFNNCVEK
jgi:hypothetical protein